MAGEVIAEKTVTGVMVMKNGKAWGITYQDGRETSYGWMAPAEAPIYNPEYCKRSADVTYRGSPYINELSSAELVIVERTTTVRIAARNQEGTK